MDVGCDRSSLQVMEKDNKESIRKYAQRWHEVVAQVNPPLLEKEMMNLFSNNFKSPYFEYLVRSSSQHFIDLVVITKRIEQVIGLGKIAYPTGKKGFIGKRKDTKVHNTEGGYKGKRNNYQKHLPF